MLIALVVFFVCYAITSQTAVYASGGKESAAVLEQTEKKQEQKVLLWSEPSIRPEWVDTVPQSATEFYFVGTSQPYDTAANARNDARQNAQNQVLKFYGEFIESKAIARTSISGSTRDTLDAFVNREEEIKSYAEYVISQIGTDRYYTELYLNSKNKEEYIVYTRCQIGRQKAEEDIANFEKNISQQYSAMLTTKNTLKGTLEGYVMAARALEQNPLHKITAYHEGPAGRVGMYGYIISSINELANSVSITSIPNRTVRRTDNLDTVVKLQSAQIPVIGPFDCRVSINGMNASIPVVNYTITKDNAFHLTIFTNQMEPGRYTVQIEMLMNEVTGNIAKNINSGFSFEVTPLNVILKTMAEIEEGIKKAVDTLAMDLQPQTDTKIGPFTMTKTNIPSDLSDFLKEKITHHAKNNQGRKYKIVEGDVKNVAVLNGFFAKRNDRVDVTLELSTPGKNADGSQFFSLSLAVLKQIGLDIEPENINKMFILDDIIPAPAAEPIYIEARFNSSTRTYKHADELELTVSAARDCYFKIIHIDVNNQFRMIYPTRNDNNSLRANVSRTIFDNPKSRYVLSGPYGAETLIVVASPVQFPNIDMEYGQPWKAATEEAIKKAIAGAGEARYPITILKPHEEYVFAKPPNMAETCRAIRDDAKQQGGYFKGNETSGFYIINNIRGSYLVSSAAPDTIQFASYFLDTYTGVSDSGTRKRGSPFNFSFAKPQNISQAVQMVRSGIEDKGGTFTGDDQQGNFRSSGIAGQYQVSDMVNVTILEKPFIIPNSLIVNEVKNFFGVR